MSMAELIAKKYKNKIKVHKINDPEEAATVLIKDTKHFDVNDKAYTEGTEQEQT